MDAGTRKIPITDDVADVFTAIIVDKEPPKFEKVIDGHTGLFSTMRMICHWGLCTGKVDLTICCIGTMKSIRCKYRISLLMCDAIPTVAIKRTPG